MEAEGWYRDPYGIHEARWISKGTPTSLVRDAGLETDDEPPGDLDPQTEFEPVSTEDPDDGADLLRADAAAAGEQGFEPVDAVQAALGGPGDVTTGADGSPPA